MCVNVSGDHLMVRFNPSHKQDLAYKPGFQPLIMRGKVYEGYCKVAPIGCQSDSDLAFWIEVCLDYNKIAVASKK